MILILVGILVWFILSILIEEFTSKLFTVIIVTLFTAGLWAGFHYIARPLMPERYINIVLRVLYLLPIYSVIRYLLGFTTIRLPRIPILSESYRSIVCFYGGIILGIEFPTLSIFYITLIIVWTILSIAVGTPSFGEVFFDTLSIRNKEEKDIIKSFSSIVRNQAPQKETI